MVTTTRSRAPIERTEHPHVVRSADTLGGEPRVEDSRIPVRQIFNLVRSGTPVDEIMESYPPLTQAQIHDAVSYAYDHLDEMADYEARHKIRTVMREQDLVLVDHHLIPRKRVKPSDVPPGATVYTWETLPEELEQ